MTPEQIESKLQLALRLIKLHITKEQNQLNRDLHYAVQCIVDVARKFGHCTK